MIDYLIRAETKVAWEAYAIDHGWFVEHDDDGPVPSDNVRIDELGPVVVTPGIYEDGVEVTPPVMDEWHHVNLRVVNPPPPDEPEPFADLFAEGRAVVTPQEVRAIEGTTEEGALQVLYPEDIVTPIRIWADGMHHATLPETQPE